MLSLSQARNYLSDAIKMEELSKYADAAVLLEQAAPIFEAEALWEEYIQCLDVYCKCLWKGGKYNDGLKVAQRILNVSMTQWGKWHMNTANGYHNMGINYFYKADSIRAIECHQEELAIVLALLGEQDRHTAIAYSRLAISYTSKGDYVHAIVYFQKALYIQLAVVGKESSDVAGSYNNLGNCYRNKGDYTQAIFYHRQSLAIKLAVWGEQHIYTANSYNNLGVCYYNKEDYDQAITYCQKAIAIKLALLGEQHPQVATTYSNLGNCYSHKNDHAQAVAYYQKALAIGIAAFGEYNPYIANNCYNLGKRYYYNAEYAQAVSYYQRSLDIRLALFGEQHPDVAESYWGLGQLNQIQGNYQQSLAYYQKGLYALSLQVSLTDYYSLPSLFGYNNAFHLLHLLADKSTLFLDIYRHDHYVKNISASLAHLQCADALIDQMRQDYKTEGSKLALAEKGKTLIYNEGIKILFMCEQLQSNNTDSPHVLSQFNESLGYSLPDRAIDLAFHFSEKSKAMLLFAGIKDAEARIDAQLPTNLVQQEYDIRIELTHLERVISEESYKKDHDKNHAALQEWQNRHFEYKQQYDSLIEQLETNYPDYYHLKYDLSAATIAQVQAALPPQTAMISYICAEQYLYIIAITPQNTYWHGAEQPTDFEGLVEDFLFSFQRIGKDDYLTYGYCLYNLLLLPIVQSGILTDINRLIIIPDGILSKLPFEALPTAECPPNNTTYKNIPYLIRQYIVSYHYSATLWISRQTTQTPQWEGAFISFAPVYSNTSPNNPNHDIGLIYQDENHEKPELGSRVHYSDAELRGVRRKVIAGRNFEELLYSEIEVRNVGELFYLNRQEAKVMLHEAATLDNFKALAGKYRYVLVAAHADYNGKQPDQTGIIFSPNESDNRAILYMGDAYNLRLQAELVVLSCCETGLGNINKGEGTMALNRGFLYSGAKNVIYTLFKVYDKESCNLTTELFRQIIAQKTPTQALHHAKLNIIERGQMPNKWAGYVLVGE